METDFRFVFQFVAIICVFCVRNIIAHDGVLVDRQDIILVQHIANTDDSYDRNACKCPPCTRGPECKDSVKDMSPVFNQRFYFVEVEQNGDNINYNSTTYPVEHSCMCNSFKYSIKKVENVMNSNDMSAKDIFTIDEKNGSIRNSRSIGPQEMFKITVVVTNIETGVWDETTVEVVRKFDVDMENAAHNEYSHTQNGYDDYHHIEERAAPTLAATDLDFANTLTSSSNKGSVGATICYQMDIVLPSSKTFDILVEIFAPHNETTVTILCDVDINSGTNIALTEPLPVKQSKENDNITRVAYIESPNDVAKVVKQCLSDVYYLNGDFVSSFPFQIKPRLYHVLTDMISLPFGSVTTSGSSDPTQNTLSIAYCTTVRDSLAPPGLYALCIGAEYDNENFIWVSCADIDVDNNKTVAEEVTFDHDAPPTMPLGSSHLVTLNMYIPYPSYQYTLTVFAPVGMTGVMSICYMSNTVTVGENFACGNDLSLVTSDLTDDPTGSGNSQGQLSLQVLLNSAINDPAALHDENRVTVKFVLHMFYRQQLLNELLSLGLALELDSSTIFIGNISSTVAGAAAGQNDMEFVSLTTNLNNLDVATNQPFEITYKVRVPPPTVPGSGVASHYIIELLAPIEGSLAVFSICSLEITAIGKNMPCLKYDDLAIEYDNSRTGDSVAERATADLGYVTNLELFPEDSENCITITAKLSARDSVAVLGNTYKVKLSSSAVLLQESAITIIAGTVDQTPITNATIPFDMFYYNSLSSLREPTMIIAKMTTDRNKTYVPMEVEMVMPTDTSQTLYHICKAEIRRAGKNTPCVTPDWANKRVEYYSKYNDKMMDRARFDMESLCNYESEDNVTEDVIEFAVYITAVGDLLDGQQDFLSIGFIHSNERMMLAQLSAQFDKTRTFSPSQPLYSHVSCNTSCDFIPIGIAALYTIMLKVPPGDTYDLLVRVGGPSAPSIDICTVRIVYAGWNLPCVTDELVTRTYTRRADGSIQEVTMGIGLVNNFGSSNITSLPFADGDTIMIETVVQANTVGTYNFDVDITLDTAQSNVVSHNVPNVITTNDLSSINSTISDSVTVNMSVGTFGNSTSPSVAIGAAIPIHVTVVIPEGTFYYLEISFIIPLASIGKIELFDASIYSVGDNLPCVDLLLNPVISKSDGVFKDVAVFSLRYVCSHVIKPGDPAANSIVVRSWVRALPNGQGIVGDNVIISASAKIQNTDVTVDSISIELTDPTTFQNTVQSNSDGISNDTVISVSGDDPLVMSPSQNVTLNVTVTVPKLTQSSADFDISLPADQSACMTVNDVRVVGNIGRNVHVSPSENDLGIQYDPKCNDLTQTGQCDYAFVSLGIIANTGTSYHLDNFADGDDDFLIQVDIQMADCPASVHDWTTKMSFGIRVAGIIVIVERDVKMSRSQNELPDLFLETSLGSASTSSATFFKLVLYHSNNSTAEARNTTVAVYLPVYQIAPPNCEESGNKSHTVIPSDGSGFGLFFEDFYFVDVFTCTIKATVNSSVVLPSGFSASDSVAFFEVHTDYLSRTNVTYGLEDWYPYMTTSQQSVEYSVNAGTAQECSSPLGLGDNSIADCQITGSTNSDPSHPPSHARLNQATWWTPYIRRNGNPFDPSRYIEVYFGNMTRFTKADVQQDASATATITEITIKYSNDRIAWFGDDVYTITNVPLESVMLLGQEARSIRIYVTKDSQNGVRSQIAAKFELYGCPVSSDVTSAEVCSNTGVTPPSDWYYRSFLVDNIGHVYVCDRMAYTDEYEGSCQYSPDDGVTWILTGSSLASMIGCDMLEGRVYGYGDDMETVMLSTDNGLTWSATNSNELPKFKQSSAWRDAIPVPETLAGDIDAALPSISYMQGPCGATNEAIFCNGVQKLRWAP